MSVSTVKRTGAIFTPPELASFLADSLWQIADFGNGSISVLDPACGNGALLSAFLAEASHRRPESTIKVFGYDINPDYVTKTLHCLTPYPRSSRRIEVRDFLDENFTAGSNRTNGKNPLVDVVIANPPYVRTQNLGAETAQRLSETFGLSGRIDLYYPFIIRITESLKPDGYLGIITSNRFLFTKSGKTIREFLMAHYDIIRMIDLGDSKLFDSAVLPAIIIARKKSASSKRKPADPLFDSIYEASEPSEIYHQAIKVPSVYSILKSGESGYYLTPDRLFNFISGKLDRQQGPDATWSIRTCENEAFLETVHCHTSFRIGDRFKVRVGIKSCADDIFIRKSWDDISPRPEPQLIRELITSDNILPWKIDRENGLKVLYPHYSEGKKRKCHKLEEYPAAAAYLLSHKSQLEDRKYLMKSGRQWYELWVPQNPALFQMPKIVFPDISCGPRFVFDDSGAIVNGNCYWICADTKTDKKLLYLIQGVANSTIMSRYHDICFNNRLYSGRRRYLSQYVEQYPIPDPDTPEAATIIRLAKRLNRSFSEKICKELDKAVMSAFGL